MFLDRQKTFLRCISRKAILVHKILNFNYLNVSCSCNTLLLVVSLVGQYCPPCPPLVKRKGGSFPSPFRHHCWRVFISISLFQKQEKNQKKRKVRPAEKETKKEENIHLTNNNCIVRNWVHYCTMWKFEKSQQTACSDNVDWNYLTMRLCLQIKSLSLIECLCGRFKDHDNRIKWTS